MSDVQAQPQDPQAEAGANITPADASAASSQPAATTTITVQYLDASGNVQNYTLQEGEDIDSHGKIQPGGITVADAAARAAAAAATMDVVPATDDAATDVAQPAVGTSGDVTGAAVVAEDPATPAADAQASADVPAAPDTPTDDAGQPSEPGSGTDAGDAAQPDSPAVVVDPNAVPADADQPTDNTDADVVPVADSVVADPAAAGDASAPAAVDTPVVLDPAVASADQVQPVVAEPVVEPVAPAVSGTTDPVALDPTVDPAPGIDPDAQDSSTTDPTTPVVDPSTGGDATGGDGSTPAASSAFSLPAFLGAHGIVFTPANNGITYLSGDDLELALSLDPANIRPLVSAGTLQAANPSGEEGRADPEPVSQEALGLVQHLISEIGEFERHTVHSVISFIEKLAPHHQRAIIDHFSEQLKK